MSKGGGVSAKTILYDMRGLRVRQKVIYSYKQLQVFSSSFLYIKSYSEYVWSLLNWTSNQYERGIVERRRKNCNVVGGGGYGKKEFFMTIGGGGVR